MSESQRLIAFHQYAGPVSMLMLGIATIVLVSVAGVALIRGTLEAASFVAVAGQFFGLAAGVWGLQKREGRSEDTRQTTITDGPATTTTERTTAT